MLLRKFKIFCRAYERPVWMACGQPSSRTENPPIADVSAQADTAVWQRRVSTRRDGATRCCRSTFRKRAALIGLLFGLCAGLLPGAAAQTRDGPSTGEGGGEKTRPRRPRGGFGGFIFGLDFGGGGQQEKKPDPVRELRENGPQVPEEFSMSDFTVVGFCKGGWPLVLDYELERPCLAWLELENEDAPRFFYRLDGRKLGPQQVVLNLPAWFGDKPVVGQFTIRAFDDVVGRANPGPLRVYALGCGPTAVGSVTIDQLSFSPVSIRVKQKEAAAYRFHSLRDFSRVAVEFYRFEAFGPEIVMSRVKREKLKGGLRRDQWVGIDKPQTWDGKDDKKKVSSGLHRFQVRVWTNPADDGSWLTTISRERVEVMAE